jgi:multidrug efflux system membrane fusion protein
MSSSKNNPKRVGPVIGVLLTLCALGLGLYVIYRVDQAPRTDDAYVYADTINVAPEVSGRIIELKAHDNQAVKQGDLLFRIDARPYQAVLSKAQASLIALDKEIMLTQRMVNAQTLAAKVAGATVEKARLAARQAGDTFARMEPLQGTSYLSADQIDQARTTMLSADAMLAGALLDQQRAEAAISGVEALIARKEIARAEIELAQLNLNYTDVVAPIDGIVIDLKTTVGQFAAAGHPVFTMVDTRNWYVIANFRETELEHIQPGQPVSLYVLGQPKTHFDGSVESIGFGVFPDDGGGEAGGLPRVPRSINWVRVAQRFPVKIKVRQPDPSIFRIGASAVAVLRDNSQVEHP